MSVVTRVRFTLARRSWIRWMLVVALALTVAQIVRNTDDGQKNQDDDR